MARFLATISGRMVYSPAFRPNVLSCQEDGLDQSCQRWTHSPMLPCTVRRVVNSVLPAFLLFVSSSQPMSSQTSSRPPSKTLQRENWVDQTLRKLSNEEKVGQLIMPA